MPLARTTLHCLVLASLGVLATAWGAAAPQGTSIQLTACQLEHPAGITAVPAECGTLDVPENPAAPNGRRISLRVARVPAVNRRKLADPLFVLAGGPGQAASDFYTGSQAAFARIQRDRDIILVDQRGTGASNALNCRELSDDSTLDIDDAAVERETRDCAAELGHRADLRFYTTSVAVQDLDRVRAALGYARINLYGVSYGTRVAQHYLRRFPAQVRAVILDGVITVTETLGPSMAVDAENALSEIFARCVREADCNTRFGNPADDYHALRASLAAAPVTVELADPASGAPTTVQFGAQQLAIVLRLSSYSATQAALLPLSLHAAQHDRNFRPLAAQFLQINNSLEEEVAYGMHNSVVCAEDVPFFDASKIDRAALEQTYLGTTQIDGLIIACRVWPRGLIDADFHQALRSAVPALLLSGGNDPATPKENGIDAARSYADSLHVIVQDQGHGQLADPCVDGIMARFLDKGSTRGLDVSCVRRVTAMPFFTTFAGPAP